MHKHKDDSHCFYEINNIMFCNILVNSMLYFPTFTQTCIVHVLVYIKIDV